MTSLEKAINLWFLFLALKPPKKLIYVLLSAAYIGMFEFIQKSVFDFQYMYPTLSPFNGYS